MGAPALRTDRRRVEPESGVFAYDERRTEPPPRIMTLPLAKDAYDESWVRLVVGIFAIAVFMVAGIARLCVGLSTGIYLLVVMAALSAFAAALLVSDEGFSHASS